MVKLFSVIAYCLIFLKGSMILVPFGFVLAFGTLEGNTLSRILIMLADLSFIALAIIAVRNKTKCTLAIEIVCYFLLLLPILRLLILSPIEEFNYFAFWFPAACFVVFYPVSVFRKYASNSERE